MEKLLSVFKEKFPNTGSIYLVKAPGRLNIIGEHTDYSGLPVLPFAIDSSLKIMFSPTSDKKIKLYSLDLPNSSPVEFEIEKEIPPSEKGHWGNYIKAAVQDGIFYSNGKNIPLETINGFVGVVSSQIPQNAGLSSSSALVVASELAFFKSQNWELPPADMAQRTAHAEQYVGTMGGGMDQTASLCGKKGYCLKIYFYPLEVTQIKINLDCSFIIANSLIDARKSSEVKNHYNQRVLESKLIKEISSRILFKEGIIFSELNYLGDLRKIVNSTLTITALKEIILNNLKRELYTLEDVQKICGEEKILKNVLINFGQLLKELPKKLPLRRRAKYLFEEWERVEDAAIFLSEGNFKKLGDLLYESHYGLQYLYEVSHPKLDELINLAKEFGLYGARMVGAGFGGSTLHLVPKTAELEYTDFLKKHFYEKLSGVPFKPNYIQTFSPDDGANITVVC